MLAVNLISQFIERNLLEIIRKLQNKFWDIKGTIDYGVFYHANVSINLFGYTDNDLTKSIDDSKNTSRYVFNIESSAIAWN